MPEYRLKNGEVVVGDLDSEDEKYIYLRNAVKKNIDGSATSYVRYWLSKSELVVEETPAEESEKEASTPVIPKRVRRKAAASEVI